MTGGGFDGSVIALTPAAAVAAVSSAVIAAFSRPAAGVGDQPCRYAPLRTFDATDAA